MVGGFDDVVDGTASSAAWRGVVIRTWVAMDVVGRVRVAVLVVRTKESNEKDYKSKTSSPPNAISSSHVFSYSLNLY
ncbi:hypothetical protein SO802_029652 [Lithocarpus litseifolius]|uniref:Uncharacterized protein n=1 Tax=Lithocarpus litseifolius TaxID=425828 RepID=A0AAW2BVD2_9ROSI